MVGEIIIRKAVEDEKSKLISIWIEKSKYLEKKGIRVWDGNQFTLERLSEKYGEPQYFIGLIDGRIFGAFILIEKNDTWWPNDDEDVFYFHKFVIVNEFCGKGFSERILAWVKEYGRDCGKKYIRLDFDEDREYLRKLYYENGFVKKGNVEGSSKHTLAEFEL